MTPALTVNGLHKSFGRVHALDGLDMSVDPGEIHGFLGPNGAGKTTTLRVLLGLLRADSGRTRLLDGDPWGDAIALHRKVAYVPGDVALWPGLTGGETIDLLIRVRGAPVVPGRREELIERFDLDTTKRNRTYSRGNRQKVALVAALAADVELYLLDEPSAGLDPLMESEFRECLRGLRSTGRTVLLSSHVLAEVEAVCDRVTIIRDGRSVESGTLDQLRHLTRTAVTVRTRQPLSGLDQIPGVHDVVYEGQLMRCQVEGDAWERLLGELRSAGVESLESRPPTLEELFLRHYEAGG